MSVKIPGIVTLGKDQGHQTHSENLVIELFQRRKKKKNFSVLRGDYLRCIVFLFFSFSLSFYLKIPTEPETKKSRTLSHTVTQRFKRLQIFVAHLFLVFLFLFLFFFYRIIGHFFFLLPPKLFFFFFPNTHTRSSSSLGPTPTRRK